MAAKKAKPKGPSAASGPPGPERVMLNIWQGASVTLENLNAKQFNGKIGVVTSNKTNSEGRVTCETTDQHKTVNVKPSNLVLVCSQCHTPDPPMRCSNCFGPAYCDAKCQIQHWRTKHRKDCSSFKIDRLKLRTSQKRSAASKNANKSQKR